MRLLRFYVLLMQSNVFVCTNVIKFYSTASGYIPGVDYNPYKLHPKDPDRASEEPPGFWARRTIALTYQKGNPAGAQKEKKLWAIFMFLLLTNLPAALYTSLIHQVSPYSH